MQVCVQIQILVQRSGNRSIQCGCIVSKYIICLSKSIHLDIILFLKILKNTINEMYIGNKNILYAVKKKKYL